MTTSDSQWCLEVIAKDRRAAQLASRMRPMGLPETRSVSLQLEARTLNGQLMEVGIWLGERNIPHKVRVSFQPKLNRIRFDFSSVGEAEAFATHFRAVRRWDSA